MRRGIVYFRDRVVGELVEDGEGYHLRYDVTYLADPSTPSISVTLPKRLEPYHSKTLFAFFCGLLAEGVQKDLQCRYLKIDEDDAFGRLLATSKNDCIGAFHVREEAK